MFCAFPRSWGCGDGLFEIRDRGQETVTSHHVESLQLNMTQHSWLMERAEPETREGRGSAACQLPHFPSLPHSPLLPHTNCYTIVPCGRTTWWLKQTSLKESWRVKIQFGFLNFVFPSSFRKWRFIFVPMRDLMDQELHLSGQTTKEYKSPYGLCYYRRFSFSVYVVSCFNCP